MTETIRRWFELVRGLAALVTSRPPSAVRPRPVPPPQPAPTLRACRPEDTIIDADALPVVRPYLVAHEQHQRRQALAFALDGVDVGAEVIHGVYVGRSA
ncbi:hypothetical protein WDH52_02020 [Streptomyces sp. TRM70308]|uniref:hypothetical protein n=1 Tax=Streptomyces sp. TRM70308 TaxID=3131932 RepID=UPI003D06476E